MAKSTSYRDLEVWKKAVGLAKSIYEITEKFPAREMYGLSSQMRRSAVSIASNIAEGQVRGSKKEFIFYLNVSVGSLAELETQLIISKEINLVSEETMSETFLTTKEVRRMIHGLMNHLTM